MKSFFTTVIILLVLTFFTVSEAFAADAVTPKIQLEMSSAGSNQTNIIIDVNAPEAGYSYRYSYSSDGGASWIPEVNLTDTGNGLFTVSYVAQNYQNYLIKIIAHKDTLVDKAAYTVAYPPNPSGHSNYSSNTNLCKNCHTTHTALGAKLLAQTNIENLCTSCHGSTANGSKYLVLTGMQVVDDVYNKVESLGGGFPTASNSSRHNYKEVDPSADPPGGKSGSPIKMSCVKCHEGHSGAGQEQYNYRLLKTSITENTYTYDTTVQGIFTFSDPARGMGDSYKTLFPAAGGIPEASGISQFCGSCHNDFSVSGVGASGPANTPANTNLNGKGLFNSIYYRHPVDVDLSSLIAKGSNTDAVTLPLFSKKMNCLTCHKAHGATTTQDDLATNILRLGNRAICENCHQK